MWFSVFVFITYKKYVENNKTSLLLTHKINEHFVFFQASSNNNNNSNNNNGSADLLDNLFNGTNNSSQQQQSTTTSRSNNSSGGLTTPNAAVADFGDDFNPREADKAGAGFGDFAAAFGDSSSSSTAK